MADRTLPTMFINDVLGAHADDPGILRIGVHLAGNVEAQLMLPVVKIDSFIGVLITGKGFFDWPPPNRDRHHGVTEVEVVGGEGKVALRAGSAWREDRLKQSKSPARIAPARPQL